MSNYPGEDPEPADGERSADDATGTEPTQPVGYWERQAAEHAREQAQQARTAPTTPYPEGSYPRQPYAGQPGAHPPPPGQPAPYSYPPGPGGATGPMPYGAFAAPRPDHPQATLALVLGLVGLIGAFVLCGVTLVVSPFAWAVGRSALKEIEASQGRLGGASNAQAGMILGIVGTVLLALAILAVIAFVVLLVAADSTTTGSSV
jgi:hypothetical protein